MEDIDVICPACHETLLLPEDEANAYECPKCDAGLVWNGKHLTGVKTNRTFLFVNGPEFDTVFDSDSLADALDFANDVMDNNKTVLSEFGQGGNSTVTESGITESMEFDRGFQKVAIVIFVVSLLGFLSLVGAAGFAGCVCLAPSLLIMAIAFGPQTHKASDLEYVQTAGGPYGVGSGVGFVSDSKYFTSYAWKNDIFTFRMFKPGSHLKFKFLQHYHNGGESGSPSQYYHLSVVLGGEDFEKDIKRINTRVHNADRNDLLEDFQLILAEKNRLYEKTGISPSLEIYFNSSVKKPSHVMNIIKQDSELTALWEQLVKGN